MRCPICKGKGSIYYWGHAWWVNTRRKCESCNGTGFDLVLTEADRERLFREVTSCNEVGR